MGSELGRRIGLAKREFKDLCKVWRHSNVTRKRKLHIFSALIESKLLYGLACCCFTKAEQRRLDGFQARCVRQVLGIRPAFFSRISNVTVLKRADHLTATSLLTKQQLLMLGKALRAPQDSLLHRAAVVPGTLVPATSRYIRRTGRPRKEWVPSVMQQAHQQNSSGQDLLCLSHDVAAWRRCMHR